MPWRCPIVVRSTSAHRAFTLVEVLIVLCVIGILAAILLPVFVRVRDGARTTACASNLRQIGLAIQTYVNDNNRYYPPGSLQGCGWVESIMPYTRTPGVFQCPASSYDTYQPGCPDAETIDGITYYYSGSYMMNALGTQLQGQLRDSRIRQPGRTILVIDGNSLRNAVGNAPIEGEASLRSMSVKFRHNNGSNVLFVDGHVKRLSITALSERNLWVLDKK